MPPADLEIYTDFRRTRQEPWHMLRANELNAVQFLPACASHATLRRGILRALQPRWVHRAEARRRRAKLSMSGPPPRPVVTLRRGILRALQPRWVHRAEARRRRAKDGGPDRDRTGDLMNAIHARSQLRYWPIFGERRSCGRTTIVTCSEASVKPDEQTMRNRSTARDACVYLLTFLRPPLITIFSLRHKS